MTKFMPNVIADYIRARRLVGRDWLESNERFRIEYRRWVVRVPLYKLALWGVRRLHLRTADERQGQADMSTTYWPRLGMAPEGSYPMGKVLTIQEDGAPEHPRTPEAVRLQPPAPGNPPELSERVRTSTSGAELNRLASFAARLARAISLDEVPQVIDEYAHRKAILKQVRRGVAPEGNLLPEEERRFPDGTLKLYGYARYHEADNRPLDITSHWMNDRTWVRGHMVPGTYVPYNRTQLRGGHGYFAEAFAEFGRGVPGGEDNPAMQALRVAASAYRQENATRKHDARLMRRVRAVVVTEGLKFARNEARTELERRSLAAESGTTTGKADGIRTAVKRGVQNSLLRTVAKLPDFTSAPMPKNWVPPVPVELRLGDAKAKYAIAKESEVVGALAQFAWPEQWRNAEARPAANPGPKHVKEAPGKLHKPVTPVPAGLAAAPQQTRPSAAPDPASAAATAATATARAGFVAVTRGLADPVPRQVPTESRAVYDHSLRRDGTLARNIAAEIAKPRGKVVRTKEAGGEVRPRRRHVLADIHPSLAIPPRSASARRSGMPPSNEPSLHLHIPFGV